MYNLDVQEILPNIFLGDFQTSQNIDFIKSKKINLIVNCSTSLPCTLKPDYLLTPVEYAPQNIREWIQENSVKYIRFPIENSMDNDVITNFYDYSIQMLPLILQKYKNNSVILIHCKDGLQVSASLMIIIIMVLLKINIKDALDFLLSKKPNAFFNGRHVNFLDAIERFDQFYKSQLYNLS